MRYQLIVKLGSCDKERRLSYKTPERAKAEIRFWENRAREINTTVTCTIIDKVTGETITVVQGW